MFALIILVVVAVFVAVFASQRHAAPPSMSARAGAAAVDDDRLHRAVDAGIITAEQAAGVLALEPPPVAARAHAAAPSGLSPATEIAGYLGAVLAMAGITTLVAQFWDDLTSWSRLALLGGASFGLLVAGLLVREADDATLRLRGFVLLLSTALLGGFAGLLGADVLDWAPESVTRLVAGSIAVQSGVLWARQATRPAQHLTTYGGLVALVAAIVGDLGGPAEVGIALWLLAAAWFAAGWWGLLPPAPVPEVLGSLTMLVSCFSLSERWEAAAPLAGLATAVLLLAASAKGMRPAVTAAGVVGVLAYLPYTIVYFFGDTVGVPVAFLLVGGLLLALAVRHLRPGGTFGHHDPALHA